MFENLQLTRLCSDAECAGEKNENRSIFGKDMGKNLWLTFWPTLYSLKCTSQPSL